MDPVAMSRFPAGRWERIFITQAPCTSMDVDFYVCDLPYPSSAGQLIRRLRVHTKFSMNVPGSIRLGMLTQRLMGALTEVKSDAEASWDDQGQIGAVARDYLKRATFTCVRFTLRD